MAPGQQFNSPGRGPRTMVSLRQEPQPAGMPWEGAVLDADPLALFEAPQATLHRETCGSTSPNLKFMATCCFKPLKFRVVFLYCKRQPEHKYHY
jgi:hypothetical protein